MGDTEGFGGAAAALLGSAAEVVEAADDKLRWWAEQCDALQGECGPITAITAPSKQLFCQVCHALRFLIPPHGTWTPAEVYDVYGCLLAGLQVMADDMGGYGTLGCQVLELLQDGYPKTPVLYYSLRQSSSGPPADTMARARCVSAGPKWRVHSLGNAHLMLDHAVSGLHLHGY